MAAAVAAALRRQARDAARWAYPRFTTNSRHARSWALDRLVALRDLRVTIPYPDWDVSGLLPALSPSTLPVAIMVIVVVVAAALGGVLAAALT